jgi:hypothetical protein
MDGRIGLPELMRVIQFYNADGFRCAEGTEDGYAPGAGEATCARHNADYREPSFRMDLSEVLRVVQIFNAEGYFSCQGLVPPSEDGFCVGEEPPFTVLVAPETLSVPEGSTAALAVSLSAPPAETVQVTASLAGVDPSIAIQGLPRLTFSPTNYSVPQTLSLSAAQDNDAENGASVLRLSAPGIPEQLVVVSEVDDDTLGILASESTVVVDEGGTVAISVSLTAAPSASLTVTTERLSGDEDIGLLTGGTRTFTPQNYFVPQQVVLLALEDDDEADGVATLRLSAPGLDPLDLTATERDNDREVIILSSDALTVSEGGTATFTARMNIAPDAPRTLDVARTAGDHDIAITSSASLVFDETNFDVPQTVVVSAAEDVDAANGTATVSVSSAGVETQSVTILESDNDQSARVSGLYTAIPFGTGTFDFPGFAAEACTLPDPPLTFSGGSSLNRTRGYELEAGRRIVLPALGRFGDVDAAAVTAYVQNVGAFASTYALVTLDATGTPLRAYCSGIVQPGTHWSFELDFTTLGNEGTPASAIVYALLPDSEYLVPGGENGPVCEARLADVAGDAQALAAFEAEFTSLVNWGDAGARAAVVVYRAGSSDQQGQAGNQRAAYNGLSDRMFRSTIQAQPPSGSYLIPWLQVDDGLESYIHIFNDGSVGVNVTTTLNAEGGATATDTILVGAGATATMNVRTLFGGDFQGVATVSGDAPVAVVADVVSPSGASAVVPARRLDVSETRIQCAALYDPAFQHELLVTNTDASSAQVTLAFVDEQALTLRVYNDVVEAGATSTFELPEDDLPEASSPGLVIVQTQGASVAGTLVRTLRDGVNPGPLQLDATPLLGQATLFDPEDGPNTGAKLLFLPVFGEEAYAHGLNSDLVISNTNVASGATAFAVYTYGTAGAHEYTCGLLRAGRSLRINVPREELGSGFRGAIVVAALASNQAGGPGLTATLRNDVSPHDAETSVTSSTSTSGDSVAVVTATPTGDTGRYGRGASILHIPSLNVAGEEPAFSSLALQNLGEEEAAVSVIFLDAAGVPLEQTTLPSAVFLLAADENARFDSDIPPSAAAATVFAYSSEDMDIAAQRDATLPGGDRVAYRALLALVETRSTEEIVATVVNAAAVANNSSGALGIGGQYLGRRDPVNLGHAYTLAEVSGGDVSPGTLVRVQNAGLAPTMLALSLRRPGLAARPIVRAPLNIEGGDLSRQAGPLAVGASLTLNLGAVFGAFDTGRLVVGASEPLALTREDTGGTVGTAAFPVALNYITNHFSAFSKVSGLRAYAPLVPSPAAGNEVRINLQDLIDLGSTAGGTARVTVFTSAGVEVIEYLVPVAPFESTVLSLSPLIDLGLSGWARVELALDPTSFPAVLQGTVEAHRMDGGRLSYPLLPEETGVPVQDGFLLRQALTGLDAESELYVLNPADVSAEVTLNFNAETVSVAEGEGKADASIVLHLAAGALEILSVEDVPGILPSYRGGVTIEQTLADDTTPGVVTAATL